MLGFVFLILFYYYPLETCSSSNESENRWIQLGGKMVRTGRVEGGKTTIRIYHVRKKSILIKLRDLDTETCKHRTSSSWSKPSSLQHSESIIVKATGVCYFTITALEKSTVACPSHFQLAGYLLWIRLCPDVPWCTAKEALPQVSGHVSQ